MIFVYSFSLYRYYININHISYSKPIDYCLINHNNKRNMSTWFSGFICILPLIVGLISFTHDTIKRNEEDNHIIYDPIVILNQTNDHPLFYDLTNRIESVRYTDIYGFPLLQVVDDFIIPPYTRLYIVNHMSSSCNGLSFSFNTIRTRQDMDPYNITIELFYDDGYNYPLNVSFFKRTVCSPYTVIDNNCSWDKKINIPTITDIILNNGDMDDNNITVFDLSNIDFIPTGRKLWVSIYATVPRHGAGNLLQSNSFYWMTLNNRTYSSVLMQTFYNGVDNSNYKFRDVNNLYKVNATTWIDATVLQSSLKISTVSYNMALKVSIMCNLIPPYVPEPPTIMPYITVAPTSEPTSTPTDEPTVINTTLVPTASPTYLLTTEEPTMINDDENNTTNKTNTSIWFDKYLKQRNVQIIVYSMLSFLIFVILFVFLIIFYRRRSNRKKKNEQIGIDKYLNDKEMRLDDVNSRGYHIPYRSDTQSLSDTIKSSDGNIENNTSKRKYNNKTWIGKNDLYTEVSIDNGNSTDDTKGEMDIRDWFQSMVPSDLVVGNPYNVSHNNAHTD